MKRLGQGLAVVAVTLFLPVTVGMPASAQASCNLSNTGSGSTNECTIADNYRCTIDNTNNIIITNSEGQQVASGSASVEGNGNGGSATTGSASNNSGTTFNVTITNTGSNKTCAVSAVVPPAQPPVTPEEPETPAPVQPEQPVIPKALPVTSGDKGSVVVLAAGSIAATCGIAFFYRRLHL